MNHGNICFLSKFSVLIQQNIIIQWQWDPELGIKIITTSNIASFNQYIFLNIALFYSGHSYYLNWCFAFLSLLNAVMGISLLLCTQTADGKLLAMRIISNFMHRCSDKIITNALLRPLLITRALMGFFCELTQMKTLLLTIERSGTIKMYRC